MATISVCSFIGIIIIFVLSVVSITQGWTSRDASLFSVTIGGTTYPIAADCSVNVNGQTNAFTGSNCSWLQSVRATILLGLLSTCLSGIYLLICIIIPQRMQKAALGFVYLMVFSWFCNVLTVGLFVGWIRGNFGNFTFEAGFTLLLFVIGLQMIVVLMLFGVVDVIRKYQPLPENQGWGYQAFNGYGTVQPQQQPQQQQQQPAYAAPPYQSQPPMTYQQTQPAGSYQSQPPMAYQQAQPAGSYQAQPPMTYPPPAMSYGAQPPAPAYPAYPPYGYPPPPPPSMPAGMLPTAIPVPGGFFIPYPSQYPMPYGYPQQQQVDIPEPIKAQSQPQVQQTPIQEPEQQVEPQVPAEEGNPNINV